jgi:outer membrane protein assembly factor BamE (lipoprotein component of BamABCDE complex)
MAKRISLVRRIAAGLVLLSLAACAATYNDHGYVPAQSELSQVKIGESKAQVEKAIGSPSLEGLKNVDAWYYVQSRWKHLGAFPPKEVKREVVAISFDKAGRVSNVEKFGLAHGNVVTISRRVTTSTVKGEGLLRQLLRDLGRFNPSNFFRRSPQ